MPVDGSGFDDLQQHVRQVWDTVVLFNSDGNVETTLDIDSDSRAYWSGSDPRTLVVTITGDDNDITRPLSILELGLQKDGTVMTTESTDGNKRIDARHDEITMTTTLTFAE